MSTERVLHDFELKGPVRVIISELPRMTFKDFQQRRTFDPQFESGASDFPIPALTYGDMLHIEISSIGYRLTIGNEYYEAKFDDPKKLETLEQLLFQWAVQEGIVKGVI